MRANHQRGIESRLAEVTETVKRWALEHGWQRSGRSARAMYRANGGARYRLDFGHPRYLKEQMWEDQDGKGVWKTVHSCPWSLVSVESNRLVRGQNACRPLGTKLGPHVHAPYNWPGDVSMGRTSERTESATNKRFEFCMCGEVRREVGTTEWHRDR